MKEEGEWELKQRKEIVGIGIGIGVHLQDAKMASSEGCGLEGLWRWHSMQGKNLPQSFKKHLVRNLSSL